MIKRSNVPHNALLRKISAFLFFWVLAISLATSQTFRKDSLTKNDQTQWWLPIIHKHNIDLKQFTFQKALFVGSDDSTGSNAFAIGKNPVAISKPGKSVILTVDEPFLILKIHEEGYNLLIAKSATLDSENNQITYEKGTMETFMFGEEWMDAPEFASYVVVGKRFSFDNLRFDIRTNKVLVKNISLSWNY
jgi:hypothetical protein